TRWAHRLKAYVPFVHYACSSVVLVHCRIILAPTWATVLANFFASPPSANRTGVGSESLSTVVRRGLICRITTFNGNSIAAVRARAKSPPNERNRIDAKFCPAFSEAKLSAPRYQFS